MVSSRGGFVLVMSCDAGAKCCCAALCAAVSSLPRVAPGRDAAVRLRGGSTWSRGVVRLGGNFSVTSIGVCNYGPLLARGYGFQPRT